MLKLFLFVLMWLRAGRSVWYDRHVGIVEAAGGIALEAVLANSNPAQSIRAARRGEPFPAHLTKELSLTPSILRLRIPNKDKFNCCGLFFFVILGCLID